MFGPAAPQARTLFSPSRHAALRPLSNATSSERPALTILPRGHSSLALFPYPAIFSSFLPNTILYILLICLWVGFLWGRGGLVPSLDYKLHEGRDFICSLPHPWCPQQCLSHSRSSITMLVKNDICLETKLRAIHPSYLSLLNT